MVLFVLETYNFTQDYWRREGTFTSRQTAQEAGEILESRNPDIKAEISEQRINDTLNDFFQEKNAI